jgi:hypothetical protein
MPWTGFVPATPATKRLQAYDLDRAVVQYLLPVINQIETFITYYKVE